MELESTNLEGEAFEVQIQEKEEQIKKIRELKDKLKKEEEEIRIMESKIQARLLREQKVKESRIQEFNFGSLSRIGTGMEDKLTSSQVFNLRSSLTEFKEDFINS